MHHGATWYTPLAPLVLLGLAVKAQSISMAVNVGIMQTRHMLCHAAFCEVKAGVICAAIWLGQQHGLVEGI